MLSFLIGSVGYLSIGKVKSKAGGLPFYLSKQNIGKNQFHSQEKFIVN